MKIEFYRSPINHHDHTKSEAANWDLSVPFEMVRGPKIRRYKLRRKTPGISWRFIFYWPSGAWWSIDVFSKLRTP